MREKIGNLSHLFCMCRVVWLVWSKCFEWMRLASMDNREPKQLFLSFRMTGVNKRVNQIWGLVWIAVVGELWKHRKKKDF